MKTEVSDEIHTHTDTHRWIQHWWWSRCTHLSPALLDEVLISQFYPGLEGLNPLFERVQFCPGRGWWLVFSPWNFAAKLTTGQSHCKGWVYLWVCASVPQMCVCHKCAWVCESKMSVCVVKLVDQPVSLPGKAMSWPGVIQACSSGLPQVDTLWWWTVWLHGFMTSGFMRDKISN